MNPGWHLTLAVKCDRQTSTTSPFPPQICSPACCRYHQVGAFWLSSALIPQITGFIHFPNSSFLAPTFCNEFKRWLDVSFLLIVRIPRKQLVFSLFWRPFPGFTTGLCQQNKCWLRVLFIFYCILLFSPLRGFVRVSQQQPQFSLLSLCGKKKTHSASDRCNLKKAVQ